MANGGTISRIDDFSAIPGKFRGGVAAIGNFDGIHRGHQAVLSKALEIAERENRPALVLTFEPHPRTVFRPESPLDRLTPAPVKARILEALGFDAVVEQEFSRDFAAIGSGDFARLVLGQGLGIAHAVTGHNFHFGHDREGTPRKLAEDGQAAGFGVTCVDAFAGEDGDVVSSTRIRALLAEGEVAVAAGLLGHRHAVEAEIIGGRRLGRTLGYPTANMALPPETALRHGIYAVRFRRADGSLHDGVASFGRRPTVEGDGAPLLETHLFDFAGDLYGEMCGVVFFGFLRGEEKFADLDALTDQMRQDEQEARALLGGVRPVSELDRVLNFTPASAD